MPRVRINLLRSKRKIKLSKRIEVINTNRSRNAAYIAWVQDKPYWATNTEVKLDWLENLMGCIFNDGDHSFITIHYDGALEYLS